MPHKVLIVDDEPNIVVPLQFLMEQNKYDVLVAHSGEEALESTAQFNPDLILLDIMLPGIDGYEVCQILRLDPRYRRLKIIFLTAKGRDTDLAKGMALGADAYIVKPFSNAELMAKIGELLTEANP